MKTDSLWTLTITARRKDGSVFVLEPGGAHAHVRELRDSDHALLELTLVIPRFQAEEWQGALTLGESDDLPGPSWVLSPTDL